jgi:hypothetical protein
LRLPDYIPCGRAQEAMRGRVPLVLAKRSRVRGEGLTRPPSKRAITACVVSVALATCTSYHPGPDARCDQCRGEREFLLQRPVLGAKLWVHRPERRGFPHGDAFAAHITR